MKDQKFFRFLAQQQQHLLLLGGSAFFCEAKKKHRSCRPSADEISSFGQDLWPGKKIWLARE
jgi:hypothetical protein